MFHKIILTALCFVLLFIDFRVSGLIYNCSLGDYKLYNYKGQILKVVYRGNRLNIEKCETVINCRTKRCVPPSIFDIEKMLHGIQYLDVTGISQWPPLPSSNSLIFVYYDSVSPLGEFGPCLNLSTLRLLHMIHYNSTFGYLRNCTKIDELWIDYTSISQTHIIIKDAPEIKALVLRYVEDFFLIEQYPLFTHRSSFNYLESIDVVFSHTNIINNSSLRTDWAQVSAVFTWQLSLLPKLLKMNFHKFPVYDMCATSKSSTGDSNIYSFEEQIIRAKITIGRSYNRLNVELRKTPIGCISCMKPCLPPKVFDINKMLNNVQWLRVKSVEKWPPIPSPNSLKEVIYDSVSPSGEFGPSCLSLKAITFRNMNQIHYNSTFGYLRNCTKLDELYIIETGTMQTHMILKDAPEVKTLTIKDIDDLFLIEQYPLFSNSSSVNYLESIHLIKQNTIDDNNPLETDWAQVSAALTWQLSTLPKLWYLDIKQYSGYDMCAANMLPTVFKSLTYLTLFNTNTTKVCFGNYHRTPQLKELYIKGSPFLYIEFRELITTRTPNLTVEVDTLQSFKFSRNDYLALASGTRKGQINFKQSRNYPMDCSCDREQTLWLMRAMAEELVVAEELLCRDDNKPLGNQTCDRLDCNRSACKSSSCVCCRVGTHEAVAAVCRDANLMALPDGILRLRNLTQLIVSNNRITSLPKKLPDTLLRFDLSGNKIQYLNDAVTMVLFEVPTRKVRLAGNPIVCSSESCYNQPLLDALQFPKNQVEDNVDCVGEAKTLSRLPEFCESKFSTQREITLILTVILIVILAIMALLALYYRQSLKMYLFARGWCLWWLQEEELDEDRTYDVFLSFCHDDVQLVLEELLPELDRDFTVCVHLRDWVPGEMIPTQILRSVEQSRRTVVVVSNSYAKSLWGLLEFRTAYASGLSEGRSRVVMVVLDDVLESQDLNGELKQYIRYHTYVRWGDPWFWSKLRYALPHKPLKSHQTAQMQQATGHLTPQLLMLNVGPSQTEI